MQESTEHVPTPQEQSAAQPSAPENTAPQQTAAEQAESLERLAEKLRKDYTRSFRKGERDYLAGMMDTGRLCHEYIVCQVKRGQARSQAVKTIEGDLNAISTSTVNANELIRSYWAEVLLRDEGEGKATWHFPYGAYRQGWQRLIQAEDMGKATERYILLPGMENDCKALFAEGSKGEWNTDSSREQCNGLLKRWADATTAAKAEQERKIKGEQERVKAELDKQRAEQDQLQQEQKAQEQKATELANAAKATTDKAEQERLEAQRVAHEAEMEQKRKDMANKQSEIDRLAREKADNDKRETQLGKERAAAEKEKDRLARAQAKKDGVKDRSLTVSAGESRQGEPLLVTLAKTAKSASSKDFGTMLAVSIRSAGDPMAALFDTLWALVAQFSADKNSTLGADDVLMCALQALDDNPELSKAGKRAVKAARVVLCKKEEPAASAQPSANGLLVVAGS
jgi:hypothetical protein